MSAGSRRDPGSRIGSSAERGPLPPARRAGEPHAGGMAGNAAGAAGGGAIYGLGMFGAWVWFWQQADGFWWYLWAIVQGIFWPAFMVYDAFGALN